MSKLFSFRFDVDTHRCVREGMPALSALGRRLDAPFTFFVNMGRAVARVGVLRRLAHGEASRDGSSAIKLSARAKLGWVEYARAAVLNPRVGSASVDVLRSARRDGHELGLHGGRNHARWQAEAGRWNRARIEQEIEAVLPAMRSVLEGGGPAGFASPGWTTHPELPAVLAERGFHYLADLHGHADGSMATTGSATPKDGTPDTPPARVEESQLPNVRTALTGEPGGVAYLEHLRARGMDDDTILQRFEEDLGRVGSLAVAYDHPYFAGVRELPLVERLVLRARELGYEVVPVGAVAEALRA